jgi:NhaA family Na+:H+ antiporter
LTSLLSINFTVIVDISPLGNDALVMRLRKVEKKVQSVISPVQHFVRDEVVSSVMLLVATIVALTLANSRFANQYLNLLHAPIQIIYGDGALEFDLAFLINDFLMVLFFLVLGLEIKREMLIGELRDPRRSLLVMAAALGGMAVPAAIYTVFNAGLPSAPGWGIPVATDTAFALGALMLVRHHLSRALKSFLVAFAIVDDLGAIIVIAIFYTEAMNHTYLLGAMGSLIVLFACNVLGLRHTSIYLVVGLLLWLCLLGAGVHGTMAGVLIAAAVPARPQHGRGWFVRSTRRLIDRLELVHARRQDRGILSNPAQHAAVEAVKRAAQSASTPLRRWERSLERPVLLLVLPLFALTNAGIPVTGTLVSDALASPVAWGIGVGLLVGKVSGITFMTWLTVRYGGGRLAEALTMHHVVGVALLGGMGFTMSVFIAGLSFPLEHQLYVAKLAILFASTVAGVSGYLWLRFDQAHRFGQ